MILDTLVIDWDIVGKMVHYYDIDGYACDLPRDMTISCGISREAADVLAMEQILLTIAEKMLGTSAIFRPDGKSRTYAEIYQDIVLRWNIMQPNTTKKE